MSEFAAVPELVEWMSAWEYRDLYRDTGQQFEEFFCPFCEIPLIEKAIYKDKAARPPHFACFKDTPHRFDCDGRPKGFQSEKKETIGKKLTKDEIDFPHKLIPRRYPKERTKNVLKNPTEITKKIIQERRTNSKWTTYVPSSWSLINFVGAYESVFTRWKEKNKDLLKQWREKNEAINEEAWNEINAIRRSMPLKLEDDDTNYLDGFRSPKAIQGTPRIYYSQGTVNVSKNIIFIHSATNTKYMGNSLPFYIFLNPETVLNSNMPRWHTESLEKLCNFAEYGEQIKWYAYGLPQKEENSIILRPASMDHIHFYSITERFARGHHKETTEEVL